MSSVETGFVEEEACCEDGWFDVSLTASFGDGSVEDYEVEDGTTIQELFEEKVGSTNYSKDPVDYIIRVNGERVTPSRVLAPEDEVTITYVGFAAGLL